MDLELQYHVGKHEESQTNDQCVSGGINYMHDDEKKNISKK
jgi:hypothetical protein